MMHSFHGDLERFEKKYKVETQEMNVKVIKMQEVAHKCLDSLDDNNLANQKLATLVTCLLESNKMTEAIYNQDDRDIKIKLQSLLAMAASSNKSKLVARVASDSKANLEDSLLQYQ